MEEEEIDVGTYDDANPEPVQEEQEEQEEPVDFQCEICKWVGKSDRSLGAHKRHNHPDQVKPKETPTRGRGRPRKQDLDDSQEVIPQRVTTKELLGGRKRPKTVVDSIDDSALRTNQEASRLHALGLVDPETPIGDYLRRGDRYAMMGDDMDPEDMVVQEEVVIGDGEQQMRSPMPNRRYGPVRRRFGDKLSDRLTIGDPAGKYKCYVETCTWRGGYRSLRMDHMRTIHPDWKMPSRYILERISKDNVYIDPKEHRPPFGCEVEGCEWRGNYRASRSTHMRKAHPEEYANKKKAQPGYGSNGTYACHYPSCTWRGWSRSTRSAHLKRVHPDWRHEDSRVLIVLSCFHCKQSFNSYPLLVDHLNNHGGVGLTVDETFESRDDFSRWMHRIEALYSMTFERHDPLQSGEFPMAESDQMFYFLHCSVVGHRGAQLASDARSYCHSNLSYLKRRQHHLMTRQKNDCSAHLEVREYTDCGTITITVKGTLEHTGHRFGTPLLRLLPMERQVSCNVLNWEGKETSREVMGLDMLDRLVASDGYSMENFGPIGDLNLMDPLHQDQIVSIRQLITQSDQECFFGVKFDEMDTRKMQFGYQNLEMKKFWEHCAPDGHVVIDTCLLDFHNLALYQYTVMVLDEQSTPKCVMLYISNEQEGAPEQILEKLVHLEMEHEPRTPNPKYFITDPSEIWPQLVEKYYDPEGLQEAQKQEDPEDPEAQSRPKPEVLLSEWALMDYWTCKIQQYAENEIDVFSIIASLRRALRTEDPLQLYTFFVELFEAFYEAGYDALAHFFDTQLTDLEYFKRWSPLRREGITVHGHPLLATSSRILRQNYLGLEDIARVDQWFAHATKRIEDFNLVIATVPFTEKPVMEPRKFYYGMMTLDGRQIIQQQREEEEEEEDPQDPPEHLNLNPEDVIIYEDLEEEIEEVVVGEEVIGHVNAEGEEIIYEEVVEEEFQEHPQETLEIQNPQGVPQNPEEEEEEEGRKDDLQKPETMEIVKDEVVQEEHMEQMGEEQHMQERDLAAHQQHQQRPPPSESPESPASSPQPKSRIPPHRRPLPPGVLPPDVPGSTVTPGPPIPKRSRGASQRLQEGLQEDSEAAPTTVRPRRETTKSVVRNRRKRDRFAELRDCPPEVMRAIAAHAIAYDGRKKEQRPFQYMPELSKLARSPVPVAHSQELRPYEVPRRVMEQQQQRREMMMRRAQERRQWEEEEERDEMEEEEEEDMDQFQRPSTSSNPHHHHHLHHGHPIHHPRQNLGPRPLPLQRGGPRYVPPHRLPPGTHPTRPSPMYHHDPHDDYSMIQNPRRRHQMYQEEEEDDVDVEEIEEVVEVVEGEEDEDIDVGDSSYYEMYQEVGYDSEVVVGHEGVVIEEVIEQGEEEEIEVDGENDDQQPCTSASLYR